MGVFCEINLFKPSDGAYQPGQVVSGIIKYAVDEPMEFAKITTSLKGNGYIILTLRYSNNQRKYERRTYRSSEVYIDTDNVIQDTKIEVPIGCYESRFNFNFLPFNCSIPSTVNIRTYQGRYNIKCRIIYYIRIKFERPGIFSFNKHFRKEITVISGGTPRLFTEPILYEDMKKVIKIFSCKSSIINIKVTIMNSVIPFGGKIELNYEIENNSHVVVKSVETKLVEIYTFKAAGRNAIKSEKDVPGSDSKTTSIKYGDTQSMPVQINVLSDIHSLEDSNIISREYFVRIIIQLPIPHINAVLNIPVQIGATDVNTAGVVLEQVDHVAIMDPPPSYWEAMGEMEKEDDY